MPEIVVGNTYWAEFGATRLHVIVDHPAAIAGWWFCKTVDDHDSLIVPEHLLKPAPATRSAPGTPPAAR
jgi:hypothetical protein